jgi:hypothetical protein
MKDKDKAPYGKGKMEKPKPGMQNRPGRMMAPKPAPAKKVSEAEFQSMTKRGNANFRSAQTGVAAKKGAQAAMDFLGTPGRTARNVALEMVRKKRKK